MPHKKHSTLNITLVFIAGFIIINNFYFFSGNIIAWDVLGYYLYLPLKFIYNDLSLQNPEVLEQLVDKYNSTATLYQVVNMPDGDHVMKYSMGLSILYSPFFFGAHAFAKLSNYPADGFSTPYQYAILISGIFYALVGIWFLSKVLIQFFSEKITIIVLLIIVFSTNYIVHITMYGQNANSHNYLFTTYSIILYLTIRWHQKQQLKHIILLAVVCGITALSRPSEIVCVLIPLFWNVTNKQSFLQKIALLKARKNQLLIFIFLMLAIGSFQFIYWKIHAGTFLFDSYGENKGEGMDFLSPHTFDVLFSFRKGWLIYTPVMIIALWGFLFIYRYNRPIFLALSIYFIFNLYIVSSWSCWWYAQSYSQRSLIPSYPIMCIGLGYFFTWLQTKKMKTKSILYTLLCLIVLLNLFQTVQFHKGVLHNSRMTKAYYFSTFGQLSVSKDQKKLLLVERSAESEQDFKNKEDYFITQTIKEGFEQTPESYQSKSHSGKSSFKLSASSIFTPAIEIPFDEITSKDHAWIRISGYVYPTHPFEENPLSFIIHFDHKGGAYKYRGADLEKQNLKLNQWNKVSYEYLTPDVRSTDDKLRVYFWLRGSQDVLVDDLKIEIFERKY